MYLLGVFYIGTLWPLEMMLVFKDLLFHKAGYTKILRC